MNSWEVIDGEAQKVLKGRSALCTIDHPLKTYTYTYIIVLKNAIDLQ
jgi:hypothetical protein